MQTVLPFSQLICQRFSAALSPSLFLLLQTTDKACHYGHPPVFVGSYREGCVCILCAALCPQVWWGYNIVILRHTETLINIIYSVWSLISVSTTSYRQHYTPCLSCYELLMLLSGCGEQLNVKFLLWMFSTKYEKIAERFHKNKIGYNLCTHLLCVWQGGEWLTIAAAKPSRLLLTMVSWTLLLA